AMKLVLGAGRSLSGRLAVFDALTFRWREIALRKHPECPVCSSSPTITTLIDYDAFCGLQGADMSEPSPNAGAVPEITPAELKDRLDRGGSLTLVDVREPFEWDISNLEPLGARLIPLDQVLDRADELDPDSDIVLY